MHSVTNIMESQPSLAKLSHSAYEDVDTARKYADEHGYDIDEELSDLSKKRNYTTYKNRETGEAVVSYRGTDKRSIVSDLINDAAMIFGLHRTKHFKNAHNVAKQAKEKYGDSTTLVGHSLGGSTAIQSGKKENLKSVTFNPYIHPSQTRSLKKYMKDTDSEIHAHVDDEIGSSAVVHAPQSHVIAYTHKTKGHAHGIEHFHGAKGVRLQDKQKKKAKIKRIAQGLAFAGAVGATVASTKLVRSLNDKKTSVS